MRYTFEPMQYVAIAFFKRNQFTLPTSANSKANRKKACGGWMCATECKWYMHYHWCWLCIGISIAVFMWTCTKRERKWECIRLQCTDICYSHSDGMCVCVCRFLQIFVVYAYTNATPFNHLYFFHASNSNHSNPVIFILFFVCFFYSLCKNVIMYFSSFGAFFSLMVLFFLILSMNKYIILNADTNVDVDLLYNVMHICTATQQYVCDMTKW